MASFVYVAAKYQMMAKAISLTADSFKVALVTSVQTDPGTNNGAYANITNEVAQANGYTTGGAALAGTKSLNISSAAVQWKTSADTTWATFSQTARGAVIYDDSTATKYLVAFIDFGGDKVGGGGNFTLTFSSATDGIIQIT